VRAVPFVSFVGAGPGEADLITVKGLRHLREAAVIVHDRLIAPELLEHAGAEAEIIDAGKAPGRHCLGQSHINWLLVDRARRRGRVVRLKGGDPAVFARLTEEIEAVRAAGIGFEVVPGVSAAMAAVARVGVSLTERGRTSMVVLATGADQHGTLPALDWDLLARAEGTLVFYMAVGALAPITATLQALGRDAREPALIVERVGFADERVLAGRLGDIAEQARCAHVTPPALLLVGPTVAAASAPVGAASRTMSLAGV
jgi:uroporphyrin-III C-methyltransferase